jgi:DNA-binding GntR family transcriptional regulator
MMQALPDRVSRNYEEHAEILDRIKAGDAEGAAGCVRGHLGRVEVLVRGADR